MFFKYPILFFIIFSFCACHTNNNNSEQNIFANDTVQIKKYFAQKKLDSAELITNNGLQTLLANKKINEYIGYNNWLISSKYIKDFSWDNSKKYYLNICNFKNQNDVDTISKKNISKALYYWARQSFRNEGRLDDSVAVFFETAMELHKKNNSLLLKEQIYAYKILGIYYNQIGDTKKSLGYYNLECTFLDTLNKNWVASNTINRAIALNEIGKYDSSVKIIKSSIRNNNLLPLIRADLYSILSMAQTEQKLYSEALLNINNATKILDTIANATKDVEEKKAQALKQKGILERIYNSNDVSIKTLQQSIKHYKATGTSNGRNIAKIYIELGKSYHANAQYDSALIYYQIALQKVIKVDSANYFSMPLKTQLYAENTILEALDAKAITLEKIYEQNHQQKYLQVAVQCYDIIAEVEKQLLQNFSYDESRLIMLRANRTRSERAIGNCYTLFSLTKKNYWSQLGFQFAEHSKAFVLLESVKRNTQSNNALLTDKLYENIQSLQTRITYLDRKLFENSTIQNDTIKKTLVIEKSKLNEQLLLANNELKLLTSNNKSLSLKIDTTTIIKKANALLDNKTAIVEFFTGDKENYIFVYTKNNEVLFFKAKANFIPSLKNYIAFFDDRNKINNAPIQYQKAALDFYNETTLPNSIGKNITALIIIADGIVQYAPFEALVTEAGKGLSPKSFSYLILSKEISYGYSIATLSAQMSNQKNSSENVLGFAPVFANGERKKLPLPNSVQELYAIKKANTNGTYFLNSKATIAQFKNNISNADIVHIATHANADTILDMQPTIEFIDSAMYLNEVYNLNLKANLVVLSACETNIGIIDKSEGAMSLARGFYYAGASNVETSLWNVNDKSTAQLFSDFYTGIKSNNYITALRNAKLNYLQNANTASASPYYWAGFIHIGYCKQQHNSIVIISIVLFANLFFIFLLLRKIIFHKY